MSLTGVLIAVLIGAICGWLAGQIVKGTGFGLIGNMVVGLLGALIFSMIFGGLKPVPNAPILNEIAGGTIGAIILLFLISLFVKR